MGKRQVRGETGPTAIHSKLGFLLSGPVEGMETKVTSANVANTHFLRVVNQEVNEQSKVSTMFWQRF